MMNLACGSLWGRSWGGGRGMHSRSMVGVLRQELRESKEVQAERLKAERARREKAGRA